MTGHYTRKEDEGAKHIPTPAEIRRKCLEAQNKWTANKRAKRIVGGPPPPVEVARAPSPTLREAATRRTT